MRPSYAGGATRFDIANRQCDWDNNEEAIVAEPRLNADDQQPQREDGNAVSEQHLRADDQQELVDELDVGVKNRESLVEEVRVAEPVGDGVLTMSYFRQYMEEFRETIRKDTIQLIKIHAKEQRPK